MAGGPAAHRGRQRPVRGGSIGVRQRVPGGPRLWAGLYGEGSFFAGLALQSSASVERTKGGVFVSAEAVGDATGGVGPGFEVKGAGDDTELAAKAGGKAGARGERLAEWELPIEALLQTLGAEQSVNLLLGRTLDRAVLIRAIAAKAIGGNTYAYTAADLLDPEIAKTELDDLSVVTSMKVEAGFGGDLGIGGVNGGAAAGLSQGTDISALKPEERRELVA